MCIIATSPNSLRLRARPRRARARSRLRRGDPRGPRGGAAREVLLCDAAASVRASIAARFAGNPNIRVIAPEELSAFPMRSLDLDLRQFARAIFDGGRTRRDAAIGGDCSRRAELIVADVIPPHVGPPRTAFALIRYAWRTASSAPLSLGLHAPRCRAIAAAQRAWHRALQRGGVPRQAAAAGFAAERLREQRRAQSGANDFSRVGRA